MPPFPFFAALYSGAANPLPPHNPPEGRTESLKGSPSLCRVSRGTGDLARVRCQLETRDLWTKFNELGTEMIITKSGRRMFPVVRISFTGLKPTTKYLVLMDIVPVDSKRYRYAYHRSSWLVAGKADPDVQQRCYVHPDAPFLGEQLSKQAVSFEKLKLTNNVMDKHGYIILNSMHKYQPRIHLIKRSAVEPFMATPPQSLSSIRSDEIKTFEFPETVFIAVTAYQNQLITKLKIDCNPFAKGFRDSARLSDFERESMETLLATHTGSGGVIGKLSNQFRAYVPGGERRAGLEEEATEEDVPSPKRALTLPSLHPSVLHQLAEVLTSSSKMHALYRKPSDGEELVKRLLSLQRYYQQKQEPGTQESPAGVSTANPSIQRVGLGKPVLAPVGGTFQGSSLKPMDLSGTGTIRAREEEQHLTSHWLTPLRLPFLPPDMNPTSPAAAMLTYLQMVQQTHSPIGGLSGPTCLPGKPAASPHIGPGTHSTQAAVVSEAAIPFFENYRQLREDTARLVPTLTTSALMK
nr:unnamed protein product [Spirometra erinaceieuropaei]